MDRFELDSKGRSIFKTYGMDLTESEFKKAAFTVIGKE